MYAICRTRGSLPAAGFSRAIVTRAGSFRCRCAIDRIREGSVAKDLDALAPLLTMATSTSVGFCTDDRNPLDIAREGHVDHLVRRAIAKGVMPEVAYRAASWSVARHYGLAGAHHGRYAFGVYRPPFPRRLADPDGPEPVQHVLRTSRRHGRRRQGRQQRPDLGAELA